MREIFIETKRLIISPLKKSNYESITKLYEDLKNNGAEVDVFGKLPGDEVENGLKFGEQIKTGFNLVAKSKDKNKFIGYLKGYLLEGEALWIYTLVIDEGSRRQSYGTEFVNALADYMRLGYGVHYVCLSVMESNKTAKYFWESLGFSNDRTMIKSGFIENKLSKINIYVKLF